MEAEEITSWSFLTAYGFMMSGRDSYTIAKPIAKSAIKPSYSQASSDFIRRCLHALNKSQER